MNFVDIKNKHVYNNEIRKACFSSGLTLKSDMLTNYMIGRWRTTLKTDIFTGHLYQSLADNIKISRKERVYNTMCYCSLFQVRRMIVRFMKLTKEDARRRVLNCAKQYQIKLLNKKLLIIYRERQDNTIRYLEVIFHERNYQHLTGVELVDKKGNILRKQSVNFYRKCIENKLGLNEIKFRDDGTTHLKLAALPILMDVTKITKITGDYNNVRPYLLVDKVIGGVNFCLGLSREGDEYVPSSALLENIKKLTSHPSQVLAILEKGKDEKIYTVIRHVSKGTNLNNLKLPYKIIEKINLENDTFKSK